MHSSARGEPPGEPSGSRWESLRGASGGAFGEPLGEPPGSLRGSLWGAGDWPPIVNEKAPCFEDGWKLLWNPVGWCKNMWDVAPLKGFGGRWTPISTAQTKTQRPQTSGMKILEIQTPRRKIPGTKTPRMKIPRPKAPRVQICLVCRKAIQAHFQSSNKERCSRLHRVSVAPPGVPSLARPSCSGGRLLRQQQPKEHKSRGSGKWPKLFIALFVKQCRAPGQ